MHWVNTLGSVSVYVRAKVGALADTHCAYPWRDAQAELTWVAGYILG